MDQFGQHSAHVCGVQECDGCPHRAVPGALIDQAHATGADGFEGSGDICHALSDVVDSFSTAGKEPAHRRVRAERFEELDPGGARWARGDAEHRLTYSLVLMDLPAYDAEFEYAFVKGYLVSEVMASDPHVVDPVQHRCLPPRPWSLGIVADVPPRAVPGAGEQWREPCQKR